MATPSVKPIGLKEHTCSQGHYWDIVPELPVRSMLVGPSGSGKTVLLINMVLGIYKGCFQEFTFGHQVQRWIMHGNLLRIISETI